MRNYNKIVVENPYPGDPVTAVRIIKMASDAGEILLTAFEEENCSREFDPVGVPLQLHY